MPNRHDKGEHNTKTIPTNEMRSYFIERRHMCFSLLVFSVIIDEALRSSEMQLSCPIKYHPILKETQERHVRINLEHKNRIAEM